MVKWFNQIPEIVGSPFVNLGKSKTMDKFLKLRNKSTKYHEIANKYETKKRKIYLLTFMFCFALLCSDLCFVLLLVLL